MRYCRRKWLRKGTLEQINTVLREQGRTAEGRQPQPSAAIIDSQTVKTTESGGERGFGGGKKGIGRKRHFLVDTTGLLLGILVHSADMADGAGGEWLLLEVAERFPRLRRLFADQGYQGEFVALVQRYWNIEVEIVRKPPGQLGFVALPRRWVVERSIAWTSRHRRLAKDYERLPESTEAFVQLAFIDLMLQRLAPDPARRQPYQRRSSRALAA